MSFVRGINESAVDFRNRVREAWELLVAPWPEFFTRGRRVPANIERVAAFAAALNHLEELGLEFPRIPLAPGPPPPPLPPLPPFTIPSLPPVDIPHIIESKNGHVEFYVRVEGDGAGNFLFPAAIDYKEIASDLLKDRKYRAYVKKISSPGSGAPEKQLEYKNEFDGEGNLVRIPTGNLDPNQELTLGTRKKYSWMLREPAITAEAGEGKRRPKHTDYEIDYAWKHLSMTDEKDFRYETTIRQYGRSITPGRLDAFVRHVIGGSPAPYVIGYLISLIPLGPDNARWLNMRAGAENCVAATVRSALLSSGSLTETRDNAITAWEATVRENGADYEATDKLAGKIKVRLQFRDLAGRLLHEKTDTLGNPVYANGKKTITVYQSDGHCSTGSPEFQPPTSLRVTLGPKIKFPKPGETPSQAKSREKENADARDRYIVETIKEYKLERAQIVGSEIISDGVIYRPICLDKAMHEAAADLKLRPPIASEDPSLYDRAYDPKQDELVPIEERFLQVGGVQSLHLKAWLKKNNILSLWPSSREAWKQSTIEAFVWTAEGEKRATAAAMYDMRAAFLACDARPTMASGPSHEASLRFGFPRGGRSRKCVATTWDQVQKLTGLIRYKSITIAPHTPPAIAAHVARHFQNRHAPIAIPAAVWLHEKGYISEYTILEVEYTERISGLTFPNNRNLAVRLIGSCSYHDTTRTFYTCDPAEKDHFMGIYNACPKPVGHGFIISYPTSSVIGGKSRDHSHIRSYVLAYQAIAMWSAIKALGENLIGTTADSVLVKEIAQAETVLPLQSDYVIKWGEFRQKPMSPNQPNGHVGAPSCMAWATEETSTAIALPPVADSLARNMTAYIEPGGFGKTTLALKQAHESRRRALLLVGTNRSEEKKRAEIAAMGASDTITVDTYHHFFKLPKDKTKQWNSNAMGKSALCRDIIIWDEFSLAGPELLELTLAWLSRTGLTTILCGDPLGQLQVFKRPESGQQVMQLLSDLKIPIEGGTGIDWRAKDCTILQAAKSACWCQEDYVQVQELKKIATKATFKQVLDIWEPGDIVIEATNRDGKTIEDAIEEAQSQRHGPQGRVDVVFKPTPEMRDQLCKKVDGVLGKVRAPIYPGFHYVPAAVGTVVSTTREAASGMDRTLWQYASRITVHSVQGETVTRKHKIFICLENIPADWCKNAVYVAMSRAELASQLYWFTLRAESAPKQAAAQPASWYDDVYE